MKLKGPPCLRVFAAFSALLTLCYLIPLLEKRTSSPIQVQSTNTTLSTTNISNTGQLAIEERMKHIRAVCHKHGNPNYNTYNLYYLPAAKITWAPVFKAGSTTWKRFFIDLEVAANHTTNAENLYLLDYLEKFRIRSPSVVHGRKGPHSRARQFRTEPEGSIRFTTVRHPLARLVSHYRNSVSLRQVSLQWDDWVRDAIIESRGPPEIMPAKEKQRLLAEAEAFIRPYAADIHRDQEIPPPEGNPFLNPPYATFPEMVAFIALKKERGKGANGHWAPASWWLDICQNDFDYVIKLEEVAIETPYLLSKLNLTEHSELYKSRTNESGDKSATRREIDQYLRQLTFEEQVKLNEIYNLDYEIFGYE